MRLRGIDFPPIMNASGARGFFGDAYHEYWYHRPYKYLGLTFRNCGFTAKTTTMQPRLKPAEKLGNMPMMPDGITPKEWVPNCIKINPQQGVIVNAVGLSGPGAPDLLTRGIWQQISGSPWNLSFMSLEKNDSDRSEELREFVKILMPCIHQFRAPVGLELNFSCPNVNVHHTSLVQEVKRALTIAEPLNVPVQCKFNALTPVDVVREISGHRACNAIVMGNTIPWGQLPNLVNWIYFFGDVESPLKELGGGGLSGPPLRKIHCQWIKEARESGISKPIWGCGGIDSASAVDEYKNAGASGAQFGTVCITRPWQTRRIIRRSHQLFS